MSAPRSPSGERARPPWALIAVVGATLALRLMVGAATHLTEDEAYYRLWAAHPAFGYYDHPPMIAWWIWLGEKIGGDTALGVRLLPALASAITGFLVFDIARLAGGGPVLAERAAIWFNATLLVLAGGFLAVPDAPASLFFSAAVWCVFRAWRRAPTAWWAAAGAAAGLACLSKYSALFLAPGMLAWLTSCRSGRASLKTPGPWIAAAVAAAVFAPNIAWNAGHDWLTFAKQFGRIAPHRFAPGYLAELLAGQFLLLNPLIAVFAVAAMFVRRRDATRDLDLTPVFALAAPFAAYLVIHSLHDRVQAHWPAPLYPLAAILAATGAERLSGRRVWKALAGVTPAVGFALGLAALAALAAPGSALGRHDLALPVRGWSPFAARLEALRERTGAAWVGTVSYGLAAQLDTEREIRAPVVQLAERDRWRDIAPAPPPNLAQPGLAVDLTRRLDARWLTRCFTRVTPLGDIRRGDPGEPGTAYAVFLVGAPKQDVLNLGC